MKDIKERIDKILAENEKHKIKNPDGSDFIAPKEGALGLLAIGYKGILAWKKAISEDE